MSTALLAPTPPPVEPKPLTAYQLQIVDALARGYHQQQIAEALGVTEDTVRHRVKVILGKTGARTRNHLCFMYGKGEVTGPVEFAVEVTLDNDDTLVVGETVDNLEAAREHLANAQREIESGTPWEVNYVTGDTQLAKSARIIEAVTGEEMQ